MKSVLNIVYLVFLSLIFYSYEKIIHRSGRRSGYKIKKHKWNYRQYTQKEDIKWLEERMKEITTKDCGLKPATNYIVGGEEAEINEFPFIVSIQENGEHFCGGVIVNHWWIITAAHCFFGTENFAAFPGAIGIMTGAPIYFGHQFYAISKMIIPDDSIFQEKTSKNSRGFEWILLKDIALIKTATEIQFNSAVNSICLPSKQYANPFGVLTTAGWGKTGYSKSDSISPTLRKVNLRILSDKQCANKYANNLKIYRSMLCATDDGKDTGSGDSGGPAFQYINGRAVLVGIVSGGYQPNPAIFTQVSYFLQWISSNIDSDSQPQSIF